MSMWGWRIALSEAGLENGHFPNYRIPPPSGCFYLDHTTVVDRSDGSDAAHGFINTTILWERMDHIQGNNLQSLVETARNNEDRYIYLTIIRGDGSGAGKDWIDIRGKARKIPMTSAKNYNGRGLPYYNDVQMVVNAVEILNDPSVYADC